MDRFPDMEQGTVLDAGCGTGIILRMIHDRHPQLKLTGIDISPDMLALARANIPAATLVEGNVAEGISGSFDVVLSLNVLHHLENQAAHLEDIKKACNLGGIIFLCDFSMDTIRIRIADFVWRLVQPGYRGAFTSSQMRSMIAKAGLKVVDHSILSPGPFWRLQIYRLSPDGLTFA